MDKVVLKQKTADGYMAVLTDEYRYDGSQVVEAKTEQELDSKIAYAQERADRWVTINGAHVLIDNRGMIVGGAGGKFNGMRFNARFRNYRGAKLVKGRRVVPAYFNAETESVTMTPYGKYINGIRRSARTVPSLKIKRGESRRAKFEKRRNAMRFSNLGTTDVSDADKTFKLGGIRERLSGDLLSQHIGPDGKLTPQRNHLHGQIVGRHLKGVAKPTGQPTMTFLGGGSAAGKSTYTKNPNSNFPDKKSAVHVDSDNIKGMLPEYRQLVADKNSQAAAYAHEESSAIAKRVMKVARERGYNVVLDGTGDNSVESMKKKIKSARDAGMRIEGVYCTCPTQVAVDRSLERAKKTGRDVPINKIKNIHKNVSQIFPQIASEFDSVKLVDTTTKTPVLIATCKRGEQITVHNEKLWQDFLAKGNEV